MRTKRIVVLMAVVAVSGIVTSTQAFAADSAGAKKPTGAPVTVMALGDFKVAAAGIDTPEVPGAIQAVAKRVNKNGGLKDASGTTHELKVVVCDGKLDPNLSADCARKAADQKMAAVIGYGGSFVDSFFPILKSAGIPIIGALPNSAGVVTDPISFPIVSGGMGAVPGVPILLKDAGATKTQTFTQEDLGGAPFLSLLAKSGAKNAGVELTEPTPVPHDQADVASAAAAATKGDPQGVGYFLLGDLPAKFIRAVRQSGYKGKVAGISSFTNEELVKQIGADANGLLISANTRYLKTTKGGRQFQADMKAYNDKLAINDSSAIHWLSADTFVRVAETLPSIDSASVLTAMGKLHNFDQLGMTPPLTTDTPNADPTPFPFPRLFNPTVFFYTIKDGKLVEYQKTFVNPYAPQ